MLGRKVFFQVHVKRQGISGLETALRIPGLFRQRFKVILHFNGNGCIQHGLANGNRLGTRKSHKRAIELLGD